MSFTQALGNSFNRRVVIGGTSFGLRLIDGKIIAEFADWVHNSIKTELIKDKEELSKESYELQINELRQKKIRGEYKMTHPEGVEFLKNFDGMVKLFSFILGEWVENKWVSITEEVAFGLLVSDPAESGRIIQEVYTESFPASKDLIKPDIDPTSPPDSPLDNNFPKV